MLAALVSTAATMCVSPPFFRVFGVSFHPPGFLLRLLSCAPSTLYSTWFFFLFPGFLSLVLGLLEQLPLDFSSAWALSPLFFFVVCQVPAGGRSCNTIQKKKNVLCMMIFASLIFGILSVTFHVFMCPKHADEISPSLIWCGRSVLEDAWFNLMVYSVLQRCAFFHFLRFFCRCYKSLWDTTNTPISTF